MEKEHGVADTTMYTMIYMRELDEAFLQNCNASSLDAGKQRFQKVKHTLDTMYKNKNNAQILSHSWNLYTRLQESHEKKVNTLSDDLYCSVKYVLYHTQQYLREKHLDILKRTDIIKDFDGFNTSKLYGRPTKRTLLDMKLKTLAPYVKKLGTKLSFKEKNPKFKE